MPHVRPTGGPPHSPGRKGRDVIVCHCNYITRADVEGAVREILARDPAGPLEVQHVYAELGKRGRCCGCFPNARAIVGSVLDDALTGMEGASVLTGSPQKQLLPRGS